MKGTRGSRAEQSDYYSSSENETVYLDLQRHKSLRNDKGKVEDLKEQFYKNSKMLKAQSNEIFNLRTEIEAAEVSVIRKEHRKFPSLKIVNSCQQEEHFELSDHFETKYIRMTDDTDKRSNSAYILTPKDEKFSVTRKYLFWATVVIVMVVGCGTGLAFIVPSILPKGSEEPPGPCYGSRIIAHGDYSVQRCTSIEENNDTRGDIGVAENFRGAADFTFYFPYLDLIDHGDLVVRDSPWVTSVSFENTESSNSLQIVFGEVEIINNSRLEFVNMPRFTGPMSGWVLEEGNLYKCMHKKPLQNFCFYTNLQKIFH